MRLDEIMSLDVKSIAPEIGAEEAFVLMRNQGLHHLVVRDGDRVVGILSSEDLGGARGARLRQGRTVADLMSKKPVTAAPDTTVKRAANMMRGRAIGCLPVLDGDELVGIITTSDLIDLIGRGSLPGEAAQKKRQTRNPGGRRLVGQESRRRSSERRIRAANRG